MDGTKSAKKALLVWVAVGAAALGVGAGSLSVAAAQEERRETAAEELVARSIAHHDPDDNWNRSALEYELETSFADGSVSRVAVNIDLSMSVFQLVMERRGDLVKVEGRGEKFTASVNGTTELSDRVREKHRLADEGKRWRDYYAYLMGMPMKLRDPGTILGPEPKRTAFQEQEVLALRVTYEPEVGTDTWYYYFEPETARLVGCRFFHDEAKNDGEYIVLEEEIQVGRMRVPRVRKWYTNTEGKFLGADTVKSVEIDAR
jgi:hypothetical protein